MTGNAIASPAAQTCPAPLTRPSRSTGMKPLRFAGSPGTAGPTARGSATTRLASRGRAPGCITNSSALLLDVGIGLDRHTRLVEVRAHRRRPGDAEDLERRGLGGHDAHLDVVLAHVPRCPRRHQRELIRGQRPGDARRHDEGDAVAVALLEVRAQAAEQVRIEPPGST